MPYLADTIAAELDALLITGRAVRLFSVEDDTTPTYTWDTNSWAYPIRNALTCRAVYNSWGGRWGGPTLIHPRFAVTAWHFWVTDPGVVGRTVRFRGTDGVLYTRTVSAQARIGTTDIAILMLDSPLPAEVIPAKVLPTNWATKLRPTSIATVPALTEMSTSSDPTMRAVVRELYSLDSFSACTSSSTSSPRYPFNEWPSLYASGSPCFLVVSNEPVLLACWYSASGGPSIAYYQADINAKMTELLGSQAQVTNVYLGTYNDIAPSVQFTASTTTAVIGTQVTLTWNVSGATAVSLDQGIGTVAATGSLSVNISDTTYTLTATWSGTPVTASVTLHALIAPTVSFTATAYNVAPGTPVTLAWSTTNATTVSLNQGIGAVGLSGTYVVSPSVNTVYTLTAVGDSTTTAGILVTVGPSQQGGFVATYYWRGNISGDVSDINNYATTAGGTTVPGGITSADTINTATTLGYAPASGIAIGDAIWSYNSTIIGGTFNGAVTTDGFINGGTFNGAVTSNYRDINGGTFNAAVTNNGSIDYGTFNGAVTNYSYIYGGTFNGSVTNNYIVQGGTFNDRLSIDNGTTWLYSPNSPYVAPANKVLAGTSNLGVAGTSTADPESPNRAQELRAFGPVANLKDPKRW